MIQELYIKNFAIIEEVRCSFEEGMTVLTGETGAGKSIIIDAVGLLIGERASLEMIRYGSDKASIQAIFTVDNPIAIQALEALGITIEDGQLMIQRELLQNGKSTCRINGQLATVALLRQIGPYLIDIHGQNEHFLLLNEEKHLELLDEFAQGELEEELATYQDLYQHYVTVRQQLRNLKTAEKEDAQRIDMLRYQVEEIEQAHIYVGEEESLIEEREYFTHFQKIQQNLLMAENVLQSDDYAAVDAIGEASGYIRDLEGINETYHQLHEQLQEAYYQLQDALSTIHHEIDSAEFDEQRYAEVEERLDVYYQLKRKYGDTAEEILDFQAKAQAALNQIENKDSIIAALKQELQQVKKKAISVAHRLTKIRHQVAQTLAAQIEEELRELYMENAQFQVSITPATTLLETGIDVVEFYISTNKGEPLKPLSKIVSGGELSRITLAMKTIFVKEQAVGTIVFDEVDTGVSGRVAQAIAEKMQYISEFAQVLCITHLPQVASMASTQIHIEKVERQERTLTTLTVLTPAERIQEVGRMLAGEEVTALTKQHAEELLTMAEQIRQTHKQQKEQVMQGD